MLHLLGYEMGCVLLGQCAVLLVECAVRSVLSIFLLVSVPCSVLSVLCILCCTLRCVSGCDILLIYELGVWSVGLFSFPIDTFVLSRNHCVCVALCHAVLWVPPHSLRVPFAVVSVCYEPCCSLFRLSVVHIAVCCCHAPCCAPCW